MSFPGTWTAIRRMIDEVSRETSTARDVARKAGLVSGSVAGGTGTRVLSADIVSSRQITPLEPYDWEGPNGFLNVFDWVPLPERYDWWPHLFSPGHHRSFTDLTDTPTMRNSWYVIPGFENPDANIRVEASLDGTTWELATSDFADDWRYKGANVNCAQWKTYTEEAVPYANYEGTYAAREGVTNAFPGGATTSDWQQIRPEFRAEGVYLRWSLDWSHTYSPDPLYAEFANGRLGLGYGEVRVR